MMLKLTAGALALAIASPAMAQGGYYNAAHYDHDHVRCDPRQRDACGEVRLDDSFFADAGGVGPAWIARGGGGGGMVIVGAGAGASASAYASASASVSVRVRGGRRGGKRGCRC